MDLYSLVTENKLILETFYTLIIMSICLVIALKADKFFKISSHNGIRYFRNAFIFFGAGFVARYVLGLLSDLSFENIELFRVAFEYLVIMAGFYLLYSLTWRKFDSRREYSSIINANMIVFHLMAIILAVADSLWATYNFMFFSQILIFLYASIISLRNYLANSGKHKFLKFYFIGMLLVLLAWILNFLAATIFQWNPVVLINIGIINVIFFSLFLYGVIKATQN